MDKLKYTVIKSEKQYYKYCKILEDLVFSESEETDEIELLEALIFLYDQENKSLLDEVGLDPIQLLKAIQKEHRLTGRDLAKILDVSEGLVSDILNYKKTISKANAKTLATHFKLQVDAFLKPYELENKQRA